MTLAPLFPLKKEKGKKNMNKKYKKITEISELRRCLKDHHEIAFALKTAPQYQYRGEIGADRDPLKSYIVGCSFSVAEGEGIYVPVAHRVGTNMATAEFHGFLDGFLSDKNTVKISHDLAFSAALAYGQGILIQPSVYDVKAAAQLILKNENTFRDSDESELKILSKELLNEAPVSLSKITGKKYCDQMNADDDAVVKHCAAEAEITFRLYRKMNIWFDENLPRHRKIAEQLESPVSIYLGLMKWSGLPVDVPQMKRCQAESEANLAQIRKEIEHIVGDVEIGVNCSTDEFRSFLYEKVNLPALKTTQNNVGAIDSTTLSLLKRWCDVNRPTLSPLFTLVEQYRKHYQIKHTFVDGYLKNLNPCTNGIHPNICSMGAETGRMSCRKPNMQNIPRQANDPIGVRGLIKAPEGSLVLSLDFSQIELRLGAWYCQDQRMVNTYSCENGDIHAETTAVIFGIPYSEAQDKRNEHYKERRTIAKAVNFGVFYGLHPNGLRDILLKSGIDKTLEECKEIIDNLKIGYPGLTIWQNKTKSEVKRKKYCETWLGRRRYFPEIASGDWREKSRAERCAMNHLIQGTAADVIKLAMGRIICGLSDKMWLKPVLQIHDELVFVIPKEKLQDAVSYIRSCMEAKPFPEFDIPLIAEAAAGPNFGSLEEIDL